PVDRLRQPTTGEVALGREVPAAQVAGKDQAQQQGGGLVASLVRSEGAAESACQPVALGAVMFGKRQGSPDGRRAGVGAGHGQACCNSGAPLTLCTGGLTPRRSCPGRRWGERRGVSPPVEWYGATTRAMKTK